jgi:hypothetical protein
MGPFTHSEVLFSLKEGRISPDDEFLPDQGDEGFSLRDKELANAFFQEYISGFEEGTKTLMIPIIKKNRDLNFIVGLAGFLTGLGIILIIASFMNP